MDWSKVLEFRIESEGFRMKGEGFRIKGEGFRIKGQGFRIKGEGLRGCVFAILVRGLGGHSVNYGRGQPL